LVNFKKNIWQYCQLVTFVCYPTHCPVTIVLAPLVWKSNGHHTGNEPCSALAACTTSSAAAENPNETIIIVHLFCATRHKFLIGGRRREREREKKREGAREEERKRMRGNGRERDREKGIRREIERERKRQRKREREREN
jgi:hypothetical protein